MDSNTNFRFLEALTKFIQNHLRAHVLIDGIVTVINDNFTVDITIQDVTYSNVPIMVLIGTQPSEYPKPVIGTSCLVTWRDGNRGLPQIIAFDQIDEYTLKVNKLFFQATKTQFNDGSNGGLPMSPNVTDRLNLIEDNQNQILDILKTIIVPTTTPYPFAPLFSAVNDLIPTEQSDIENPDISQ